MGILDTLTTGFNIVSKRIWLVALPVALDVGMWLGPKVSIAPVVEQMVSTFRETATMMTPSGVQDPNLSLMFDGLIEEMQTSVGRTNLLSLLSWGRLGVPGLGVMRPIVAGVDRVIQLSGYGQMLLAQIAIMAMGLLLTCVYLALIAGVVREEEMDLQSLVRRAPLYWLRLALLIVPFGAILIFAVTISLILGPFAFFIWVSLLWILVYMTFVPQAVTLAQDTPLRALWHSFAVVRTSFWSTLGLVLLINVIGAGLGLIWRILLRSTAGTAVAILANAYVGTGLTVATYVYFREHLAALQQAVQKRSTERPA